MPHRVDEKDTGGKPGNFPQDILLRNVWNQDFVQVALIPEPEVLIDIPHYTHAALPESMDIVRYVHYVQAVCELKMRQVENRPEKEP